MQRLRPFLKGLMILAPCFSVLWLMSLNFGAAFREEIEIVNNTGAAVSVTPIGVWHGSGKRSALPVTASREIHWPALQNGDFAVPPGQSIRIDYDMDDINPSEIYINAGTKATYEKKMKSRSSMDYDYDKDRRIEITDLAELPAASAPVTAAALRANKNGWKVFWISLLLFGPLVVGAGLWVMLRIFEKREAAVAKVVLLVAAVSTSATAYAQQPAPTKSPDRFHVSRMDFTNPAEVFPGFSATGSTAAKLDVEFSSFGFLASSNTHPGFPRAKTDEYGINYEVHGLSKIRLMDGYYKHDPYSGASFVRDEELSKEVSKDVYVLPLGNENSAWLHGARIVTAIEPKTKKVRATITWYEPSEKGIGVTTEKKEALQELTEGGTIDVRGRVHRVRTIELTKEAMSIRPFVEIDQTPLTEEQVAKEKIKESNATKESR